MRLQAIFSKFWLLVWWLLVGCAGNDAGVTAVAPLSTALPTAPIVTPTAVDEQPDVASPLPQPTAVGAPSIGDPYAPELGNTGYDVQAYTIQIGLDPSVTAVQATTTLTAEATLDNLGQFSLDFVGYEIDSLLVNGTPADYSRADDKLFITLPTPAAEGELFTVAVTYAGSPTQRPSRYAPFAPALGLFFPGDGTLFVLSEPDGSRFWFPNNDHPRDKATYRMEISAPMGLTAVANGLLLAVEDEVRTSLPSGVRGQTFIWEHQRPMASYLATLAIGPYELLEDVSPNGLPLRHYTFAQNEAQMRIETAVTGPALDWMSDLFGPYPFETFGFVTASASGVSLETQTAVILSTGMIDERTMIHEMAHMWFGDWVSLHSWQEMWRNEGFATYISLLWEYRDDPEGLELEMAGIETAVEEWPNSYPLGNPPPIQLFGAPTYFKGALMVHALRLEMGDEAFWAGLRNYFQQYGHATASDAEFQAVMEEASGLSLDAFFAEWLE
jgi:aminopeptidase N